MKAYLHNNFQYQNTFPCVNTSCENAFKIELKWIWNGHVIDIANESRDLSQMHSSNAGQISLLIVLLGVKSILLGRGLDCTRCLLEVE